MINYRDMITIITDLKEVRMGLKTIRYESNYRLYLSYLADKWRDQLTLLLKVFQSEFIFLCVVNNFVSVLFMSTTIDSLQC